MFKEKNTIIENIAFMGIVAAINVLLSVLAAFLPITSIFILIFLPFFSSVVALLCKWKYYPIYFFATIGVALAATFWNIQFTLFNLIPSLITGFLFGLSFKKHLSGTYALLFTSVAQCAITFALIPLINVLCNTDIIDTFLKFFKLNDNPNAQIIVPSFIYLIGLIQMVFSYIVLNNELKKFKADNWTKNNNLLIYIGLGISLLLIPFIFFALSISYLFMFIGLLISVSLFIDLIETKKKGLIIISSVGFAFGFLSIFMFYSLVKMPYTLILINISNICILLISLLYNLIREKKI